MRKMKKFAEGGSDKYKARYDRKVADIESDYKKAQARKTGRAAEVAKAKYEQRMADAKDDLAKWTGGDRTATRAAEKAAGRDLTLTRRYGSNKPKLEDKPLATPKGPSEAEMTKISTMAPKSQSFKEAFAAARKAGSRTFSWNDKSYTTKLASESRPAASRPRTTTGGGAAATRTTTTGGAKPATTTGATTTTTTTASGGAKPTTSTSVRKAPEYKPSGTESRVAQLRADAAASRKLEGAPAGTPGAAAARLKKYLGITSSRENTANTLERQAQEKRWRDVETQGARDAADYAKKKKREERIAAGRKPNATPTEKFYAKYPDAMKKGGKVKAKGYAKGGKIDGCAVRGKTKVKRGY